MYRQSLSIYNDSRPNPSPNPSPNPDDAGRIVRRPMELSITTVVIQARIEPGSVVTPLALRCSALDHCTTWEPKSVNNVMACLSHCAEYSAHYAHSEK